MKYLMFIFSLTCLVACSSFEKKSDTQRIPAANADSDRLSILMNTYVGCIVKNAVYPSRSHAGGAVLPVLRDSVSFIGKSRSKKLDIYIGVFHTEGRIKIIAADSQKDSKSLDLENVIASTDYLRENSDIEKLDFNIEGENGRLLCKRIELF